jgi:aquaporin NIP
LTFGLVVMALAFALGGVSGAHLNPAVTIALAVAGRFPWKDVVVYIVAQIFGAFAASFLLAALAPDPGTLGATLPANSATSAFVLEIWLTALLVYTALAVSASPTTRAFTPVAVGAVVGLEAMFAGPICGASMNPARSLAPAIVSGHTEFLTLYLAAPLLGGILAVPICIGSQSPGCCTGRCTEPAP